MKLIQQLMYAGIISCSMGLSSIAYSASFNEAMEAFENRDYVSAYRDFSIVAMTGDRDAQFMLGYVYSKGYGTTQNYVQAHKWFNLAAAGGDREARRARDNLTKFMSAQQISQAQQMAAEWQPITVSQKEVDEEIIPAPSPESESFINWSNPSPEISDATGAGTAKDINLTRDEKRELQRRLRDAGYDPGPIDGLPGERTLRAIRSYQSDFGMKVDGLVSREIYDDLGTRNFNDGDREENYENDRTLVLVKQLRELDKDGQNKQLAGQQYKQRISAILADYDRPWSTRVLFDNFRDGDYTLNPRWIVESGNFSVSSREYLYSSVPIPRNRSTDKKKSDTQEIVGIFSDIFLKTSKKDKEPEQDQFTGYSEIYSAATISNSFSARVNLNGLLDNGRLNLGVYQGTSRINGYTVSYSTGPDSSIELIRKSSQGKAVLASINLSQALTGDAHNVELRRNQDGKIEVSLDDTLLFSAIDTALYGNFDGFVIGNHGGNFKLMEIEVYSEN